MPFKNKAQRRACYVKAAEAEKRGDKPTWNCKNWDGYKFCGAKCKDGCPCERKCTTKRCWQHTK